MKTNDCQVPQANMYNGENAWVKRTPFTVQSELFIGGVAVALLLFSAKYSIAVAVVLNNQASLVHMFSHFT